jgi:hypothetical protein
MVIGMLDHIKKLDQMIGPRPPVDQAQVQAEVTAYLLQRGRDVAPDHDLGHAQDQDLIELGRLDCIAQRPGVDPKLAVALEWAAHNLTLPHIRRDADGRVIDGPEPPPPEPDPVKDQELALVRRANACLAECNAQGRLRECRYFGLQLDRRHRGEPILHLDPDQEQDQAQTAPETGTTATPEIPDRENQRD